MRAAIAIAIGVALALGPWVHTPGPTGAAEPERVAASWGNNALGQVGDGTSGNNRLLTVPVNDATGASLLPPSIAVAAGWNHSLALAEDGTVWAWGSNAVGQAGDNTSGNNRLLPVHVKDVLGTSVLGSIIAIEAGGSHSLALASDGTVWAWGSNDSGQIGDSTIGNNRLLPVQVKASTGIGVLSNIVAIAAGGSHSLALSADGTVWAWGANSSSQAGDGSPGSNRPLPVHVKNAAGNGSLGGITAIAAGGDHNLALDADGSVWVWGANDLNQAGDDTNDATKPLPVHVKNAAGTGILGGVTAIAAGYLHNLALDAGGGLWAWGYNGNGQAGDNTQGTNRRLPVRVKDTTGTDVLANVAAIAAGSYHSLALVEDGTIWAWGNNAEGEAGDNTSGNNRPLPAHVKDATGTNLLRNVTTIAAGEKHNLVLAGTAAANIAAPATTRGRDIAVTLGGVGFFPIDGYYLSESPAVPGIDSPAWAPAPITSFQLSPGDGAKTLYGFVRDARDFVSPAATASVVLDAAPPASEFGMPAYTRSLAVRVSVGGFDENGVSGYFIKATPGTPSLSQPGWTAVKPESYTLADGSDGVRTLYLWVRDPAGNLSAAVSASTNLDRSKPTASLSIPAFTTTTRVAVTLGGQDTPGITGYLLSTRGTPPSPSATGWKATKPTMFTFPAGADGAKTLYAWTKDAAGNVSKTATDTTILDRKAPLVGVTAPKQDAKLAKLTSIAGTTNDPTPGSGNKSARYAIRWKQGTTCKWWKPAKGKLVAGPCGKPAWFGLPAGKTWTKAIGTLDDPGACTLMVEAKDRAGNIGKASRRFTIVASGGTPAPR